jgi:hypothetical protein
MENNLNLKLLKKHCEYLESKPEYGMGYQLADIELKDGSVLKKRIILNACYLKLNPDEEIKSIDIKTIKLIEK